MVCVGVDLVKHTMYQCKVDVDMLNTVKSVLADVSSVSPSSEQRGDYGLGEMFIISKLSKCIEFVQNLSKLMQVCYMKKTLESRFSVSNGHVLYPRVCLYFLLALYLGFCFGLEIDSRDIAKWKPSFGNKSIPQLVPSLYKPTFP